MHQGRHDCAVLVSTQGNITDSHKDQCQSRQASEQVLVHSLEGVDIHVTYALWLRPFRRDHNHLLHGTAPLLVLKGTLEGARSVRGGIDGLKAVD